ncbi:MAG: AMP-binding protein, partial [Flavobacteriales bacterium]|nr:AMP-binding protein [Flavobacteriales bacterium]
DGELLTGEVALAHFEERSKDPRSAAWANSLNMLVRELIGDPIGPITAHTSGTTGTPKPVVITREDLVASAELTGRTFDLHRGDRSLLCLPCAYIGGKMMVVRAMVLGLDLHVIDPRGSVLENLDVEDRFAFTAMVPLQLHRAVLADRAAVEQRFATILLGGGPVSKAMMDAVRDLRTAVYQGYGSTETVTHVAIRGLNKAALVPGTQGSMDEPFHAIGEVSFGRDPRGCLVVYTPHLSTTQHVTNDIVELLGDTRFRWLGRWDNVILSGGKKLHPEQLEARTVGVIPYPHYFTGTPDAMLGQAVTLVIEADRPVQEVLPEVMDALVGVLDPHELPRKVRALDSFERTMAGKIIRNTPA